MACACNQGRTAAAFSKEPVTYRVYVSGRQVYESNNQAAAEAVAARFSSAEILAPGTSNP